MEIKNRSGRRKTAVARVYMKPGDGNILINKKDYKTYFTNELLHYAVEQPLKLTDNIGKYDISVNVQGGGIKGQAEAVRLGISKVLTDFDPEYRAILKPHGLLRRDPRMVERKKPGQKKARKKFQFSKR